MVSMVYGQNTPWKTKGNSVGRNDYLGTNNNQSLIIKTNSQKRMQVNSSGGVEVNDFLKVNGYVETDSLYVKGSMIISDDEGSFYFDPNIGCDRMRVSTGNFAIMGGFNFPPPWGWQVVTPLVNVGIGTQNAQSKLHLFTPTGNVFSQTTNNITSASATDGFLVGINTDGVAELRQQEDLPIRIFTNDGVLHEQRMIISHDAGSNVPRVGIGTSVLSEPRTFLHIGQNINTVSSGYRTWMNIGELVVNDQSDNMYFGFSDSISIPGTSDYIINWGARSSDENNNILRFVNTTANTAVTSGSDEGLEVARMVSNGTDGSMGINIDENPTETLDVDGNARIRQVPFGEFDSVLVINGDGVLHWRNFEGGGPGTSLGGNTQGFVGIGTKNPKAALHVANGDIAVTDDDSGIILKASNGENYYRILVDDNGNLYTEQVNIK